MSSPQELSGQYRYKTEQKRVAVVGFSGSTEASLSHFFGVHAASRYILCDVIEADYVVFEGDQPGSDEELQQKYQEEVGKPGIVVSTDRREWPGLVWLRKPLSVASLESALQRLVDENSVTPVGSDQVMGSREEVRNEAFDQYRKLKEQRETVHATYHLTKRKSDAEDQALRTKLKRGKLAAVRYTDVLAELPQGHEPVDVAAIDPHDDGAKEPSLDQLVLEVKSSSEDNTDLEDLTSGFDHQSEQVSTDVKTAIDQTHDGLLSVAATSEVAPEELQAIEEAAKALEEMLNTPVEKVYESDEQMQLLDSDLLQLEPFDEVELDAVVDTVKESDKKDVQPTELKKEAPVSNTVVTRTLRSSITEELVHQCVGNHPDIDLTRTSQLRGIFINPDALLLPWLVQALLIGNESGHPQQVNGLPKVLVYLPNPARFVTDFDDEFLSQTARSRFGFGELSLVERQGFEVSDGLRTIDADALIWKLAMLTVRGRVLEGLDPLQPRKLKAIPDFKRLFAIPHAKRIAKLWYERPMSANDVVDALKIPQRFVFTFMSAASVVQLFDQ